VVDIPDFDLRVPARADARHDVARAGAPAWSPPRSGRPCLRTPSG
jgi:hypothetical protein